MRPSNTADQRCLQFEVEVQPRARVFAYRDYRGNWVHHFDIPRRHGQLAITARAQVQIDDPAALPEQLPMEAWRTIDEWEAREEEWEYRQPSRFAEWSPALLEFAEALGFVPPPRAGSLSAARARRWRPSIAASSTPPSPRGWIRHRRDPRIGARRVPGLHPHHARRPSMDGCALPLRERLYCPRAVNGGDEPTTIATHAWVEALLPELGWVGLDPTHNMQTGLRHIRVAVGRDYADVPPTRGTFKGQTASVLEVSVEVTPADTLPTLDRAVLDVTFVHETAAPADEERERQSSNSSNSSRAAGHADGRRESPDAPEARGHLDGGPDTGSRHGT